MLFRPRPVLSTIQKLHFHTKSKSIVLSDHVQNSLLNGEPIVALESTIITHGMPQPHNLNTAKKVESIIREKGVTPATIAVIRGRIHVGLEDGMLEELAMAKNSIKISRRDFPYAIAKNLSGGTTVAGTMMIANQVGIPIFVTGGIGGVHRQGQDTMDISADLTELGRTPIAVICAGVKSILDIGRTLEYLETQGVCVATLSEKAAGKEECKFPSFFSAQSSFTSPLNIGNCQEAASLICANLEVNKTNGVLVAVPIPEEYSFDSSLVDSIIDQAVAECEAKEVRGKAVTPFILEKVNQLTGGKSLEANKALIENNAVVGATIALEMAKITSGNRQT